MKCPHCGGEYPDTANFCPKYGKKISSSFASCPNPLCKADDIPNTFVYSPYCGSSMNNDEVSQSQEDVNFQAAIGVGCNDMENPDNKFVMVVDDIFDIKGRGVVLDGTVAVGRVSSGDVVRIIRQNAPVLDLVIAAIAKERTIVETASAGEHVGILFEGLSSGQVNIGDVITNR